MSVSTIASASAWEGLRHRFAANRGMMVAVVIFGAMFAYYGYMQPVGLSSNVINTASNKGVLLALVAMAQTLPVLTGGIDLSVGTIFLLTNCLASNIVVGNPIMTTLGVIGVLLAGTACGALNGVIVVYGRLQPIIVTIATSALFYGLALILRPQPGGSINPDLADLMTRSTYWVPSSLRFSFWLWCCSSGSRTGARSSAVPLTLSAHRNRRRICRASPSARRNSLPMRWPASYRQSPACR